MTYQVCEAICLVPEMLIWADAIDLLTGYTKRKEFKVPISKVHWENLNSDFEMLFCLPYLKLVVQSELCENIPRDDWWI